METKIGWKKTKNTPSGITLIALIITIIVMLILVGVRNKFVNKRKWNI